MKGSKQMSEKSNIERTALKAGSWYIICNFINKGIAFITMPIFTRLLSKTVIGEFSNYTTWLNLFLIIFTLDVHATVTRARFDFKTDLDGYLSSISIMSAVSTIICALTMSLFWDFFQPILGVPYEHFLIMCLTIVCYGAYEVFMIKQRVEYKYKMFSIMTLTVSIFTIFISIVLVIVMEDKLVGRIYGYTIPHAVVYVVMFLYIVNRGRKFNLSYCKYCLKVCLPFVPHLVSMTILSTSDRAMINNMVGSEATAIYTVGYSCGAIITLLSTSMNQAWAPWLSEQLHEKNYFATRKVSIRYLGMFALMVVVIALFGPELVMIMGGKSYIEAKYVLPPILAGGIFQFAYSMFVNIETYEMKTGGMALATVTAAAINVGLNYAFIPIYGYIAAAYTTLVGYGVLFLIHFILVKRLGMTKVYPVRKVCLTLATSSIVVILYTFLYMNNVVRYSLMVGVVIVGIILFRKYRDTLISIIKELLS